MFDMTSEVGSPVVHAENALTSGGADNLCKIIAKNDFALLSADKLRACLTLDDDSVLDGWAEFQESWNRLEQDQHMKDGGKYRYRRHAVYSAKSFSKVRLEPYQPHYQSVSYNSLNGGIARYFSPIEPSIATGKILTTIMEFCRTTFASLAPLYDWHIEAHQFRIVSTGEEVLPTPEGMHRDGVSFVFMMLVNRVNVVNGETRIYNRECVELARHTLAYPMDSAFINDDRTMHGVTPILAADPKLPAYRDVLVITFNKC